MDLSRRLAIIPTPSANEIEDWSERTALATGLTPPLVRRHWLTRLQALGIINPGGRRPDERRHQLIEELLAKQPPGPGGRRRKGIWDEIAQRVADMEAIQIPFAGHELRSWLRRHKKTCPEHYGDTAAS
jgi:hypothetical protein